MLVEAVVVAGYGSGADVGVRPDPGVADISQVIDLGALLDLGLLDLDEVADSGVGGDVRSRPQTGERADRRAPGDPRALEMRERADHRAVADFDSAADHDMGLDEDVAAYSGVIGQEH